MNTMIALSRLAHSGTAADRELLAAIEKSPGLGIAIGPIMRHVAVLLGLTLVGCSSSTSPKTTSVSNAEVGQGDAGTADAAACSAPPSADAFDQDAGIGCKPANDACEQTDAGVVCQSGCASSDYGYVCLGQGDAGAPEPASSLNCSMMPVPVNIKNVVHYCCPCGN